MDYASLIQALLGVLGQSAANGNTAEQLAILKKALAEFDKMPLPTQERMTAEEIGPTQTEVLGSSAEDIRNEREMLDELLKRGRDGGMTAEDLANFETARGNAEAAAKTGEDRIRERMYNHGLGGGGSELAMQLSNNQGAAQRAHEASMRGAADASRRAIDSILQGGRLAGQIRSQNYDEAAKRAGAADARLRYNLEARQRARQYNAGLGQQDFENAMARASGRSGQASGLGNFYGQQAANTRQMYAGLGKAGGDLVRAAQTSYSSGATPAYNNNTVSAPPLVQADDDLAEWNNPWGGY